MKKVFAIRFQPIELDVLILLMRIVVGITFITTGWGKIQDPFHWMGNNSSLPGILQALAAVSEFGGGIAIILGIITRLAAFGISCTMLVAVCVVRFVYGAPFIDMQGGAGYVLPCVLLLIALFLLINGPGRFSIDRILFGERLNNKVVI